MRPAAMTGAARTERERGPRSGPAPHSRSRGFALAAVAALVYMGIDQATKQLVMHSVGRGEHVNVFFGIDITNTRNTGVAFGALAGKGVAVTVLTVAAITLLIAYFVRHAAAPWLWLPVGVVVGGAFGNLLDRARQGAVTDFIDPHIWPTFNVADAGIVVGVLGLLYLIETDRRGD